MIEDTKVERVLAVAAHPDDLDFGASGTIAGWTAKGIEVVYVIVTDGDAGGFDPDVPRDRVPEIRRAEQQAAAGCVGVTDVRFLGYSDGRLELSTELRRDLTRVIRQVRPQRMIIPSPERDWTFIAASHPDHLTTGEAAMRAVYPDARNPFAHPELLRDEALEAWTVPEVWLVASPRRDHVVDITETFDQKLAALRAHTSQTAHLTDLPNGLRSMAEGIAREAGLPSGSLAESFYVVSTA